LPHQSRDAFCLCPRPSTLLLLDLMGILRNKHRVAYLEQNFFFEFFFDFEKNTNFYENYGVLGFLKISSKKNLLLN